MDPYNLALGVSTAVLCWVDIPTESCHHVYIYIYIYVEHSPLPGTIIFGIWAPILVFFQCCLGCLLFGWPASSASQKTYPNCQNRDRNAKYDCYWKGATSSLSLYIYMYIYIYICMHACMHVCIHTHIHTYTFVNLEDTNSIYSRFHMF